MAYNYLHYIIIHCLLLNTTTSHNNQPWKKKSMGCYDGTEDCELVRIYIFNKLSNIINKDSIVLYRDDGLGIFQNMSYRAEIEKHH